MEVVAFVGPAGTGKSYMAQKVAREEGVDGIVDDGLFIQGGKILAGFSAKSEQNRIQAVKRAIFNEREHAEAVKQAIVLANPVKLLILGTSEEMVRRISAKLGVPEPDKIIDIEDVATKREIARAKNSRYREGKHIVPVPVVELKPHYSGYLIDPFRGFFSKNRAEHEQARKSVVRPAFSMYGKMLIADAALSDMVKLAAAEIREIKSVISITVKADWESTRSITITIETIMFYGAVINDVMRLTQQRIKQRIEEMTTMNVVAVNIFVRRLALKQL